MKTVDEWIKNSSNDTDERISGTDESTIKAVELVITIALELREAAVELV